MNELSREEWLKNRLDGIGGSEASVVMGVNPWKSLLELWTEKVTRNVVEKDTPDLKWGKILEPVIADEYMKHTGRYVYCPTLQIKSKDYPFMNANIDRFIAEVKDKDGLGVLEIKTKGAFVDWEKDEIPIYYQLQMQHYLCVTGLKWGSFAVLDMGKKELIIEDVERDDKLIKELIEAERIFWEEYVIKKIPPSVDSSKACEQFLRDKYSKEEKGKEIDLTFNNEAGENAFLLNQLKKEIKDLQDKETKYKNVLMSIMGDAEIGLGHIYGYNYKITWKSDKDKNVFDEEEFKKDFPEEYKMYLKPKKGSRRFTIRFTDDK